MAVEFGWDPNSILGWSPLMFQAVLDVLEERENEAKRERLLEQVRGGG